MSSLLNLPPSVRNDTSEAGIAWRRIHGKTARRYYDQFCQDHPASAYVAEAEKRRLAISDWEGLDRTDPIEIHFFLLTHPFEALRKHAEASMKEAIQQSNAAHRGEFWRQVGIPFHVLLPLIPLGYILAFAVAIGLYELTGHGAIAPYVKVCTDYVRRFSAQWPSLPYYEHVQPAAAWLVEHIERIERITLAVVIAIVAGHVMAFVSGVIVKNWIEPRARAIQERLDRENASSFEAVL